MLPYHIWYELLNTHAIGKTRQKSDRIASEIPLEEGMHFRMCLYGGIGHLLYKVGLKQVLIEYDVADVYWALLGHMAAAFLNKMFITLFQVVRRKVKHKKLLKPQYALIKRLCNTSIT